MSNGRYGSAGSGAPKIVGEVVRTPGAKLELAVAPERQAEHLTFDSPTWTALQAGRASVESNRSADGIVGAAKARAEEIRQQLASKAALEKELARLERIIKAAEEES